MRFRINNKFIYVLFAIGAIFVTVSKILDLQDDKENHCEPTGKQRWTNSMVHSSDNALSTIIVQDEWKCKNGKIKWKTPYGS